MHSYFGHEAWAPRAPALKTLRDALEIRGRILLAFEAAERETDAARREALLTFVVIGGGPTGVELAGALAEIARHTSRATSAASIRSRRGSSCWKGARVLPTYTEALSAKAEKQLANLGVTVRTGKLVTEVDAAGVTAGGERIAARTILWAAGWPPRRSAARSAFPPDRAGRVHVEPDLTIPGRGNIYVIGDLAHLDQDGRPLPGVAPVAIQMGRHTARNLARTIRGEPRLPFRYKDKGNMATIGRKSAVAQIGPPRIPGFPRVGHVAHDPHPLPHRVPQPLRGDVRVGLGLLHIPTKRAGDPGAARESPPGLETPLAAAAPRGEDRRHLRARAGSGRRADWATAASIATLPSGDFP